MLKALEDELSTCAAEGLVGVSCLAKGADQLFAQAVLDRGARSTSCSPLLTTANGR